MKSKKEFALAMMEGRKFKLCSGVCYYDESEESPFRYTNEMMKDNEVMQGAWDLYADAVEVLQWYHSIPACGTLCRVGDELVIIARYAKDDEFPFKQNAHVAFKSVTPLTMEEIKDYIHDAT